MIPQRAEALKPKILAALTTDEPITMAELAVVLRLRDTHDLGVAMTALWSESKVSVWGRDISGDEPGPWRRPGEPYIPRENRQVGYALSAGGDER